MDLIIKKAEFIGSSTDLHKLPQKDLPEVAIVGRSNVGKSTFINRATMRKRLARISSTPGRTREINFFEIEVAGGEIGSRTLLLVDLPGFGFAKMAKTQREQLNRLMVDYMLKRLTLRTICLLNDARRLPQADELAVCDLATRSGRKLLIVLTKLDQLQKSARSTQVREIADAYGVPADELILSWTSTTRDEFWNRAV